MANEALPLGARTEDSCSPLPPSLRKPRLMRGEASSYLQHRHGVQVAESTLAKLASTGGGPLFCKFGRNVYYTPTDLDSWVEAKMTAPKRNTAA